jgi:hypothetical protein
VLGGVTGKGRRVATVYEDVNEVDVDELVWLRAIPLRFNGGVAEASNR